METVIVLLIVALAAAVGVWTFYRAVKGKGGCSCSQHCKSCSRTEKSDDGR
ncbi:MAG: hypothetical protein B6I25_01565 [Planctomycetales bacterium 4572_13]|nr:MAG: hypothetical protein B6I25_01565 [Planctomycetales bacterium 4572_13]